MRSLECYAYQSPVFKPNGEEQPFTSFNKYTRVVKFNLKFLKEKRTKALLLTRKRASFCLQLVFDASKTNTTTLIFS